MNDIRRLLNRYPPDCRPLRIEPLDAAGGMSGAKFWRTTAPRGMLALRRWPPEHPGADRLHFIHAVIHHAARTTNIVPVPIQSRDGQSFIAAADHFWELAPWMPGTADYRLAPSDEKLRAAMIALAQFHNAVSDFQPPPQLAATPPVAGAPAIPRRLTRLRELNLGRINALTNALADSTCPELARLAREFLATLPNAIPRAVAQLEPLANIALPIQPCLRDVWHDHVLFTGNQVTGLIDFGAVDLDTPAADIARLLGSLVHGDRTAWESGLAAYSAARRLSPNESLGVFAIDAANPILAGTNWIHWIYVEKREFEDRGQVIERFREIIDQIKSRT